MIDSSDNRLVFHSNRQAIVRSIPAIVRSSRRDTCASGREMCSGFAISVNFRTKVRNLSIPMYVTPVAECVREDSVEYGSDHLSEALSAWLDSAANVRRELRKLLEEQQ